MTKFYIDKIVSQSFGMNYIIIKIRDDDNEHISTVKIHGGSIDVKDDMVYIEDQSEWLSMCMRFCNCVFSPECAL